MLTVDSKKCLVTDVDVVPCLRIIDLIRCARGEAEVSL